MEKLKHMKKLNNEMMPTEVSYRWVDVLPRHRNLR